jgi:hypothetical protein
MNLVYTSLNIMENNTEQRNESQKNLKTPLINLIKNITYPQNKKLLVEEYWKVPP